jgi:aspartyl/glutamyl-tRNA(Asn/Gln) amidotransferase C subunit
MDKITREELLEIAEKTKIAIAESDIEAIRDQVSACLAYAVSVQKIAKEATVLSNKNSNHDRADVEIDYDSQKILAQSPQHEDNYFVVPKILDN